MYPEPWQVILQTPQLQDDSQTVSVQETVVLTSRQRPSYAQAVQAMMALKQ